MENNLLNSSCHLSGALRDSSGNYDYGFYLAGSCMIISGLLFLLIQCINHLKQKRRREDRRHDDLEQSKTATAIMRCTVTLHSALEWQLGLPPSEELDGMQPVEEEEILEITSL